MPIPYVPGLSGENQNFITTVSVMTFSSVSHMLYDTHKRRVFSQCKQGNPQKAEDKGGDKKRNALRQKTVQM